MFKIALKSLIYRRWSLVLTISTLLLSIFLLILVSRVHDSSRKSFTKVISNTDLIVGPRTSPQNLLMYSALGIGQATHNVSSVSFEFLKSIQGVSKVIPIAIGDSYKGYPVIGTNSEFLERPAIKLLKGKNLNLGHMSAVLGSEVANRNQLKLDDQIAIDHGSGKHSFESHDDMLFTVSAILSPTGTPLDRFVHVHVDDFSMLHAEGSHEGEEQTDSHNSHSYHDDTHHNRDEVHSHKVQHDHNIHKDSEAHHKPEYDYSHGEHHEHGHANSYNAFFVKVKNKSELFQIKQEIDNFKSESLISIIPGQALLKFWENFKVFELAIEFMAIALILMSMLAVLSQILSNIQLRVKELTLYKISGASNYFIVSLVMLEVLFIGFISVTLSYLMFYLALPFIMSYFLEPLGLYLDITKPTSSEAMYILIVLAQMLFISFLTSVFILWYSKKMSVRVNRGA